MAQELAEYTPGELERAATEFVTHKLDAREIIRPVFSDDDRGKVFLEVLRDLPTVALTGRTLREAIGFHSYDYSQSVKSEALVIQHSSDKADPQAFLLRPLLPYLLSYPERVAKPDLDFLVTKYDLGKLAEMFRQRGFPVVDAHAFNGVRVVDVTGDRGVASFADSSESWFSQLPAPKLLTVNAPLETGNNNKLIFHLHTRWGNLYLYPLACPGLGMNELADPTLPKSISAVARALMLAATVSDPGRKPLKIPMTGFRGAIYDVVEEFAPVLRKIKRGELPEPPYSSAIRSMSLALLLIVRKYETLDRLTRDHFFGSVVNAHHRGVGVHKSRPRYGPEGRFWKLGGNQFA